MVGPGEEHDKLWSIMEQSANTLSAQLGLVDNTPLLGAAVVPRGAER
jgi:uncharacterized ferritin-like protein (DUF455 family)